jgi:hypothetical protein
MSRSTDDKIKSNRIVAMRELNRMRRKESLHCPKSVSDGASLREALVSEKDGNSASDFGFWIVCYFVQICFAFLCSVEGNLKTK